jgi:hypothetical protein
MYNATVEGETPSIVEVENICSGDHMGFNVHWNSAMRTKYDDEHWRPETTAVAPAVTSRGGHASSGGSNVAHEAEVHRLEDIMTCVGINELMLPMRTCRDNASQTKQNQTNLTKKCKQVEGGWGAYSQAAAAVSPPFTTHDGVTIES